ncbi:hypothetical protein [Neomegalonema sp.]|uniref:WD40 repeat domain-containing protein n=1 Tax=Neomegalonema sp. TaxID=2039713 RepID=UPI00263467F8|nr:hypothetical protein [Neomegalonema sp.]MDD2869985.1 hypothetical protein [Neomegalonema sp.]
MAQTLSPPPPAPAPTANTALFDLLARSWTLEAPVSSIVMDRAGKTAAFVLADGRVALAPLDEEESSISRLHIEGDTGRSAIRPRKNPPARPTLTPPLCEGAPFLVPSAGLGFIAGTPAGEILRVTPRGQTIPLAKGGEPLTALASDGRGRLGLAHEGSVRLVEEEGLAKLRSLLTPGAARALAFAPGPAGDGSRLAIQLEGRLLLWSPDGEVEDLPLGGVGPLAFSPGGAWLAGADEAEGFWLRRMADGASGRLGPFRARPAALTFTARDREVFASGAFRAAGWSLETPPLEDPGLGALRSGRASLVLVERVAAHPKLHLLACGAADGTVTLTRPGQADELTLRLGEGEAVGALAWSPCGLHLAIGAGAGFAALATLPPQMFK